MRPVEAPPIFQDDLEFASLIGALDANIRFLNEKVPADRVLQFGPRRVPKTEYVTALQGLLEAARKDAPTFYQELERRFEAFEVYGGDKWGEVFLTSYFEPVIEGARRKEGRFDTPIYGMPKDLVSVDLGTFLIAKPDLAKLGNQVFEQRSRERILRGRLVAGPDGNPRVEAYLDRAAIYREGLGKTEVLAWVDPIDAFFLEIQGSGVVRMKNGKELKVGYAGQNGFGYVPIGKHLTDVIPKEKLSLQTIEAHLRSLPVEGAREVMGKNPSYVFFRKLEGAGVTYFGTEVVAGRTIATDQSLFPKGALAFLEFEKPLFASKTDSEPLAWQPSSRFVLDQDTGGAIRGPGRVDLFWGRGPEAKQNAGVMKGKGRLIYFVPKAAAAAG